MQLVNSEKKGTPKMRTPKNKIAFVKSTEGTPKTPKLNESLNTPSKAKKGANGMNKSPKVGKAAHTPAKTDVAKSPLTKSQKKKQQKLNTTPQNANGSAQKNTPKKRKVQEMDQSLPPNKKSKDMDGNAKNRQTDDSSCSIRVRLPYGVGNRKPLLLDLLKHSDFVGGSNLSFMLKFTNEEEAQKKLPLIQKLKYEGRHVDARFYMPRNVVKVIDPLSAGVFVDTNYKLKPGDIKDFYKALSIEEVFKSKGGRSILYKLQFKTEGEVKKIYGKKMELNGRVITANPFFTKEKNDSDSSPAEASGMKKQKDAANKTKKEAKMDLVEEDSDDEEEEEGDDEEGEEEDDDEEGEEEDSDDDEEEEIIEGDDDDDEEEEEDDDDDE